MTLSPAHSDASFLQFSGERSDWRNLTVKDYLLNAGRDRIVGFFPGLGSRAFYQNLGRFLLDSGIPEVVAIYRDGARALGFSGQPERLLIVPNNMPNGKLEQQGFIGAALLVHSLALDAYLRATAEQGGMPLNFVAYTGESFGIITSAVASGSISVGDGVKIAHAFTPLMLVAAEGGDLDDPFAHEIASYLPDSVRGKRLVPEPSHVVALQGSPEDLAEAMAEIENSYPRAEVEIHKLYSRQQKNIYVRASVKPDFDLFMKKFPGVEMEELKSPTTFLAHSERMRGARRALARFIEENGIVFQDPHTPVASNNGTGLLTAAAEVRSGILAITDEIMASQATVETLDSLQPDIILELGLGNKSVRLLTDNNVETPVLAYTGTSDETDLFLRAVKLVDDVKRELVKLHDSGNRLEAGHHHTLRDLFQLVSKSPFCERYFYRTMGRIITNALLRSERDGAAGFYRFLEVFQHTYNHRGCVEVENGELVLRARLKKRTVGPADRLGQVYAELEVIDRNGDVANRSSITVKQPEVVVFHFDRLADIGYPDLARKTRLLLDTQPLARQLYDQMVERPRIEDDAFLTSTDTTVSAVDQIAMSYVFYQYALFHILRLHRPAVFTHDYYLEGSDPLGWLVALAASGAVSLSDIAYLCSASLRAGMGTDETQASLGRMLSSLKTCDVSVISPEGVPLRSKKDLEAATRTVFRDGARHAQVRSINLNGNCQIISLGSALDPARLNVAGPFRTEVISVLSPTDLWKKHVNPALDEFEERSTLALTEESERVLRYAQSRRILSSTFNAYVNSGESIVGFGKGGSESMTLFLAKEGEDRITVRKILSEALTTAHWNPNGEGVMLPPFTKAKKQAEFLQALPESVRRNFPAVHGVLERDVPIPFHLQKNGKTTHQEVIYEMTYVKGKEVGRFIEEYSPRPVVIARLYEQIFRLLNQNVHTVNRCPAPGDTLEISYFRKIEDRLDLCRRTAPHTFGPELLDTERIVINGISYLNSSALLRRFREQPEFHNILEPRFHSLVMGDTNTENIKITDPEPLHRAHWLIETGAPPAEIDAALAAITPESIGITFLDPRAIGFKSHGRTTRDDPMYDNKPWHNSIGHYDEIHHEHFKLRVRTGSGRIPSVDIEFIEENPYQKAYRVRDVETKGEKINETAPQGMEDYFAPVMTAVYDLDNPESQYVKDDPYWLIRFVFMMGTHFTAMPPFHFQAELDGTLTDTYHTQRRPVAIYCEGIKWLNWALEMLEGRRKQFLGLQVPSLPHTP